MSAARARRLLLAAFAVSLLVHLFLAGYIRWPQLEQASREPQIVVRQITIARMPRRIPAPPTPAPTPIPTPVSTPAPTPRASIAPPRTFAHAAKAHPAPRAIGSTGAAAHAHVAARPPSTPVPAPAPSATSPPAACLHSDTAAAIASTPDPVDIPPNVRAAKASGTTSVQVSLSPQGQVTNTTVTQSSGNPGLDAVAIQMARTATYTPQYSNCKAVAGTYTFTAKFVAW
jgi:TonB family protein